MSNYRPLSLPSLRAPRLTGALALLFVFVFAPAAHAQSDLVITGVIDGPLDGGLPKAVEVYVLNDIVDLSAYGLGSANNGGGSDDEEFTFPAVPATAGDFLYVAAPGNSLNDGAVRFQEWFGFPADYIDSAVNINGDDAIELFMNGSVVDTFGDIDTDGTGEAWEYLDGWAYREDGTGPDGSAFVFSNWTFSGRDALDGETSNATADDPFPVGSYAPPGEASITLTTVVDRADAVCSDLGDVDSCDLSGSSSSVTATPGEQLVVRYTVENTGDVTLTTHNLLDSAKGPLLFNFTFTLDPGASVFIRDFSTAPGVEGSTTRTAVWSADDGGGNGAVGEASYEIVVESAVPDIRLDPVALNIGDLFAITGSTGYNFTFDVCNDGDATLTVSDVTSSDDTFVQPPFSPGVPATVAPGACEEFEFLVSTAGGDGTAMGSISESLTIVSDDPDEGAVELPVTFNILTPIEETAPASIDFGDVAVGDVACETITISNVGNFTLDVDLTNDDIFNDVFFLDPEPGMFEVSPGASETATLCFQPTALGPEEGELSSSTNDFRGDIVVELAGTGVEPDEDTVAPTCGIASSTEGPPAEIEFFLRDETALDPSTILVSADANAVLVGPISIDPGLEYVYRATQQDPSFPAQVTISGEDAAGNAASCTFTFGEPDDTEAPVCGAIAWDFDGTDYFLASSATDNVGITSATITRLSGNLEAFVGGAGPSFQGDVVAIDPAATSLDLRARLTSFSGSFAFLITVEDAAGNTAACDPVITEVAGALPEATALGASYPNPARVGSGASVTVPFTLAEATEVRVVVYDVLGREVAVLADGAMEAGRYEVGWSEARSLPSGTYVVRLTAGALTQTRRMMLLR